MAHPSRFEPLGRETERETEKETEDTTADIESLYSSSDDSSASVWTSSPVGKASTEPALPLTFAACDGDDSGRDMERDDVASQPGSDGDVVRRRHLLQHRGRRSRRWGQVKTRPQGSDHNSTPAHGSNTGPSSALRIDPRTTRIDCGPWNDPASAPSRPTSHQADMDPGTTADDGPRIDPISPDRPHIYLTLRLKPGLRFTPDPLPSVSHSTPAIGRARDFQARASCLIWYGARRRPESDTSGLGQSASSAMRGQDVSWSEQATQYFRHSAISA